MFPEVETRILFLCLFYISRSYSGHLRSDFVVLLLLLTARSRRTKKRDKKNKRDMKSTVPFALAWVLKLQNSALAQSWPCTISTQVWSRSFGQPLTKGGLSETNPPSFFALLIIFKKPTKSEIVIFSFFPAHCGVKDCEKMYAGGNSLVGCIFSKSWTFTPEWIPSIFISSFMISPIVLPYNKY